MSNYHIPKRLSAKATVYSSQKKVCKNCKHGSDTEEGLINCPIEGQEHGRSDKACGEFVFKSQTSLFDYVAGGKVNV